MKPGEGPLDSLIRMLAGLPGLGSRSARRAALHLLTNREKALEPLIHALEEAGRRISECGICGNLDTADPCRVCADATRRTAVLCVVGSVADLWALERTQAYRGLYHILGGLLSALDGVGPENLRIAGLLERARQSGVEEVILALPATVDGQSTAHYLTDRLEGTGVRITRLAHGLPVGGELDYLDDGTIATALRARANI